MRVAVDAVGARMLRPVVEGAVLASKRGGHEVLLCGPEEALRGELRLLGASEAQRVSVLDAPNLIQPGEDPAAACREKPDASVMRAAENVAARQAEVMVSVAEPAIAAAAALWHLKRLRGVLKPALACPIRTRKGTTLLLDAGACVDCKPWHLLQFALMGTLYARGVLGVRDPSVRLLSAGGAEERAGQLVHETLPLLKYAGLRFAGMIRGDELPAGAADIVLADGITGDVAVRLIEGLSRAYSEMLESELESGLAPKLGAALARGALDRAGEVLGAAAGGAPLLGVDGSVMLCRPAGIAEAEDVCSAVLGGVALEESDVRERLRERLEDMKSNMEFSKAIE